MREKLIAELNSDAANKPYSVNTANQPLRISENPNFCPHCGNQVQGFASFCRHCAKPINAPAINKTDPAKKSSSLLWGCLGIFIGFPILLGLGCTACVGLSSFLGGSAKRSAVQSGEQPSNSSSSSPTPEKIIPNSSGDYQNKADTSENSMYVSAFGQIYGGLKVYHRVTKELQFTIVGGNDEMKLPNGDEFRAIVVEYPNGTIECKDRSWFIKSNQFVIRKDDPALKKFEWEIYYSCPGF